MILVLSGTGDEGVKLARLPREAGRFGRHCTPDHGENRE